MMIKKYITNININIDVKHKEEIFKLVGNQLYENKSVADGYILSMIEKDKRSSASVVKNLAIIHGIVEYESLILKNDIILTILKNPIKWDGNDVKYIFGLALDKSLIADAIAEIGQAFSNQKHVNDFFSDPNLTQDEIKEWISNIQ